MLLGDEHAEKAVVADELPDVVGDVVQLVADAPIVEPLAQLVGRPVEKGALLVGERDRRHAAELGEVGLAGEQLGVPADGAGLERLALGVGDGRHGALQRAVSGQRDVFALDVGDAGGEQEPGDEPAEKGPQREAEPELQDHGEDGDGDRPGHARTRGSSPGQRTRPRRAPRKSVQPRMASKLALALPPPQPKRHSRGPYPTPRDAGRPQLSALYGPDGPSTQVSFRIVPPRPISRNGNVTGRLNRKSPRFLVSREANWLTRWQNWPTTLGNIECRRARAPTAQPVSGRARGRQTLRLVPLRAEQEAALLRRLPCRHRHRAADVHGRAHGNGAAVRLQGYRRSAVLRRLAHAALNLGMHDWPPFLLKRRRSGRRPAVLRSAMPEWGKARQASPWPIFFSS